MSHCVGEPQLSSPTGPLIMTFLVKISAGWCPPPKKGTSHGASDVLFCSIFSQTTKPHLWAPWPPVLCRSNHKQHTSTTAQDSALLENSDSELDPNLLFDPGLVKAFMNPNLLVMIWRIIELKYVSHLAYVCTHKMIYKCIHCHPPEWEDHKAK